MRRTWLLAALAVGCAGVTTEDPIATPTPSPTESATGTPTPSASGVRVVSLNILHGILDEDPAAPDNDRFAERLPLIAAELEALGADVVLLQEVNQTSSGQYPDVRSAMKAALGPDYRAVTGDIFGSPSSVDSGDAFGQMILTRLPIVEHHNRKVVEVQVFSPRSVLHVRVTLDGGGTLDLYDAHLRGPSDPADASAEMADVLDFIADTAAPGGAVVLGGDFNSKDDEWPAQLLRDAGFTDLGAALVCTAADNSGCTSETLPLAQPGNRTSTRIDYLWARGLTATAELAFGEPFTIPGGVLWASDHRGLRADLSPAQFTIEAVNGGSGIETSSPSTAATMSASTW